MRPFRRQLSRARRGSVYMIVVAILAVLALLSLTLAYTTQMELEASRNWVDLIQTRFSSITGVPFFNPNQDPDPPIIGFDGVSGRATLGLRSSEPERYPIELVIDPREQARSRGRAFRAANANDRGLDGRRTLASTTTPTPRPGSALAERATAGSSRLIDGEGAPGGDLLEEGGTFNGALATARLEDESAKINVNSIVLAPKNKPDYGKNSGLENLVKPGAPGPASRLDAEQFALFIEATLAAQNVQPQVSPLQLAEAIVVYRYGLDGKPGVAGSDDDGNAERSNPYGDGSDNDGDLVIDNPEEDALSGDADGIDNNRDGQVDEPGESIAQDGMDNDLNGEVDEPGEGVDDPGECPTDIRVAPFGDDRPYQRLSQLMAVPGMTRDVFAALAPHLTVFSASQPVYEEEGSALKGSGLRRLDPNTATAEEIYEALARQFRRLPKDLLAQYAVNIVDRRDADDEPTELELGTAGQKYVGFEISPVINEVGSYTGAANRGGDQDGGDDGQFVEIANPYTQALSVEGWRIEVSGNVAWLNGSIPAGGFLVITDDYNERGDQTPEDTPGEGSLYGVYGAVPSGQSRVVEWSALSLPDDKGSVGLFNRDNVRVDSLSYKDGRVCGALRRTFQRRGAFERKAIYDKTDAKTATPFKANLSSAQSAALGTSSTYDREERDALRLIEAFQNQPFRSPLEVLLVPTNYTPSSTASALASTAQPAAGAEAEEETAPEEEEEEIERDARGRAVRPLDSSLRFPDLYAGGKENLDARVVDLFQPLLPQGKSISAMHTILASSVAQSASPEAVMPDLSELAWKALRDRPEALFGQINLDTASAAVLAAMPGIDNDLAYKIMKLRIEWHYGKLQPGEGSLAAEERQALLAKSWFEPLPPQSEPRWDSLSDFLQDDELWGEQEFVERFVAAYPFSMMSTFRSLSYKSISESIANPEPEPANGKPARLPSVASAERIIAGDRGRPETVVFQSFGGFYAGTKDGDRDILFGLPESQVEDPTKSKIAAVVEREHVLPLYDGPMLREPREKKDDVRRSSIVRRQPPRRIDRRF